MCSGKPIAFPENVTLAVEQVTGARVAEMTQHAVHFFPDGSSSGELIILSGGNHSYYLQINWLTGSITITEGLRKNG